MTDREYPAELEALEIWVVWARDSKGRKRPRAPWLDGHAYPTAWGEDEDRRPETDFDTALTYSQLRKHELDAMRIDFEPDIPRETLEPGLILPHSSSVDDVFDGRRLMQVDLDDVRDPATGEIHPEARRVIEEAAAYGSVSVSGEGVHVLVWARLPDGKGKYIGELDDEPFAGLDDAPQIELYDHGRHVALTGDHLPETPLEIPERPELVDEWIDRYPDATDDGDGEEEGETAPDGGAGGVEQPPIAPTGGSGESPYYSHPLTDFALPAANVDERNTEVQGAHPVHGGTSSSDSESSNYNIDKRRNVWHCFAHDSGGGPLKMAALMEGELSCGDCRRGALDELDDEEFFKVCLKARDLGFEGPPPYRALVETARRQGLSLADPDEGVLGRSCYAVAERIFEHL